MIYIGSNLIYILNEIAPNQELQWLISKYRKRITAVFLDETEKKILDFLKKKGPLSTKYIAEHIGLSERNTRRRLSKLLEKGKLQTIGRSNKDPHKKYAFVENR